MTTDGIDGRVVRTKRGFCSFLSSETRAHTHKSREKGVFFFFFACFLLITRSISLKPYTLLLCFFLRPFAKKSFDITFLLFFRRDLCVFFSADKRRTHAHTREKNEWQSNKIMLRHASVTTRRRSFDAVVNAARAVSVF